MYKVLISFMMLAFIFACAGKDKSPSADAGETANGEQVFKKYCITCHGADGKLGVNGAKDLTACKFTLAERENQVRKGKNTMTPFEGILTEAQIKAVAEYTMTLK